MIPRYAARFLIVLFGCFAQLGCETTPQRLADDPDAVAALVAAAKKGGAGGGTLSSSRTIRGVSPYGAGSYHETELLTWWHDANPCQPPPVAPED